MKLAIFRARTALTLSALALPAALAMHACAPEAATESAGENAELAPYPHFQGAEFRGERNFAALINTYLEGKIEPTPWAGYWWPYTANGIAAGGRGGSPAGKYDAVRGGTTGAQNWEASMHGSRVKGVQGWWGHCNGWCVASALFPEPKEDVKVNGVVFTNADVKALLTEAGMATSADYYGNRVDFGNDYSTPKYTDTVPDQYFLILTNYIGKLKQAVLIDRYTGDQVWNQPLAGYRMEYPKPSDYLGADPAAPDVYRILITSTIWWQRDDVSPGTVTTPFNFEESEHTQSRTLRMEVWLDAPVVFDASGKITQAGNVIVTRQGEYLAGGSWRIGDGYYNDGWPDYMWIPYSVYKPTDPDQDYANPHIDIEWIKAHLLVPGGADDNTTTPRPIEPAPVPCPRPSSNPSVTPRPTVTSTSGPIPTFIPTSTPTSIPTWTPRPTPTSTGGWPWPPGPSHAPGH